MAEVRNKQVILKEYVRGFPKESDMILKTSSIKLKLELELEHSESESNSSVLVKNLYLSCDPYMRNRMTYRDSSASYVQSFNPSQVSTLLYSLLCLFYLFNQSINQLCLCLCYLIIIIIISAYKWIRSV